MMVFLKRGRGAKPGGPGRAERGGARGRGGFVFVMVLILMVMAVATIGWSVARVRAQSAIVALQVDEYQRHHEMLGVRALVADWLTDMDVRSALAPMSRSVEAARVVELPTGALVTLWVQDGQAAALGRLDLEMTDDQRALQVDILSRLPLDDRRLVRSAGPLQISLWGAPFEILLAAARGNYDLANVVDELRRDPELNRARFLSEVRDAGFNGSEGQELLQIFTLNPMLWRVNVEVVTDRTLNRYTLLAQAEGNIVEILEWRALPDGEEFPAHLMLGEEGAGV
ncbi:MAG: hypothetical protein ACTS3F_01440 [Phycisphaerales bacterium]